MTTLPQKIDEVFASKITSYSVDLLTNSIKMDLSLLDDGVTTEHTVEFLRVATMYYINGSTARRKGMLDPLPKDSYLELSNMGVIDPLGGIEAVIPDLAEWAEERRSEINFYIEIWNKTILLETAEVRIDGESFVIGDW